MSKREIFDTICKEVRASAPEVSVVTRSFDDVMWSAAGGEFGVGGANNITDVVVSDKDNSSILQLNTGQMFPVVVKTNTKAVRIRVFDVEKVKDVIIPLHEYLTHPRRYTNRGLPPAQVDTLLKNPDRPDEEEPMQVSFKVLYMNKPEDADSVQFSPTYLNYGTCNGDDPQNLLMFAPKNGVVTMETTKPGWARLFPRTFQDGASKRVYLNSKDTGVNVRSQDKEELIKSGFSSGDDEFLTIQIPLLKKGLPVDTRKKCCHFQKSDEDDMPEEAPVYRSLGASTNIVKLETGDVVEAKDAELADPSLYNDPLSAVGKRGPGEIRLHITKVVIVSGPPTPEDVKHVCGWLLDASKVASTFTVADWKTAWETFKSEFKAAYPDVDPNPASAPPVKHFLEAVEKESKKPKEFEFSM